MRRSTMDLGLKGRVALVPASSKGIGYGIARVLAAEGCKVSISSRNSSSISKARQRIVEETGNKEIFSMKADLNIKDDIAELVRSTNEELGRVDILAYNTGPPKPGTFSELSEDDWNTGISLLLT